MKEGVRAHGAHCSINFLQTKVPYVNVIRFKATINYV